MNADNDSMRNMQIGDLLDAIASEDIETKVIAIQKTAQICSELANASVEALKAGGEGAYFVAERLVSFGTIVARPLEDLLASSVDTELQIIASLILLGLGIKTGVNTLINFIGTEGYTCVIVRNLARSGVIEVKENIINLLREYTPNKVDLGKTAAPNPNKDMVVCLLDALETLGGGLPDEMKNAFMRSKIPSEIRKIVHAL